MCRLRRLVYAPEGFEAVNRKVPFAAARLGHDVLIGKKASLPNGFFNIERLDPLDSNEILALPFNECNP